MLKLPLAAMVFLLPLRAFSIPGMGGATPGLMIALFLIIVIWSQTRVYRRGWPVALFIASLMSAPLLIEITRADHDVDSTAGIGYYVILIGALLTYLALLWSKRELGLRATALLYSAGWILQQALSSSNWSTNAWKYAFAWPVTIFLAALIYNNRSRLMSIALIAVLAALSIMNDYRSNFGLLVVAGLIVLWLWKRKNVPSGPKATAILIGLTGIFWAVYQCASWLALQGYLGARNQMVTASQIANGENLLTSGRVESSAAFNLFLHNPFGYGPGVAPNSEDVFIAKTALQATGVNLEGDYVNTYVLGDQIKLHSVASDLWVSFGLAGLILAAYLAWLLLTRLVASHERVTVLYVFASLVALWDIAFSPITSNIHEVIFAAVLATPLLSERHENNRTKKVHIRRLTPHEQRLRELTDAHAARTHLSAKAT
ncbi:hypothetical protein SAMN04487914_106118 [Arthrobacter sp. ok909]|nr:hypothetical protein SAMN04487914_106118 [Arthrobacter sp. ok909]